MPWHEGQSGKWLFLIIVLAGCLRLAFFVGLASGDPQDDGIYYKLAVEMSRSGTDYLRPYAHLRPGALANPIDQFPFRPLAVVPSALLFTITGPSEYAAVVWPMLCSLMTVALIFRIGSLQFDRVTGLIGSALYAIYPLEVINATRILADAPLEMFCAASLWLWLEGRARNRRALWLLAGIAAGCGYLTKPPALMWFGLILVWAVIDSARQRVDRTAPWMLLAGLALVIGIEASVYWHMTGDPLANLHIHRGAEAFKYLNEPSSSATFGRIEFRFNNGAPFELSRTAFGLDGGPTFHFGLFFWLFAVAAIAGVMSKRCVALPLLAVATFVYFESGPADIRIDWVHHSVRYFMLPKSARFLMMATPALVVASAWFVNQLRRRSAIAMGAISLLLVITSVTAAARTSAYYRAGLHDLRALTSLVMNEPNTIFWGDLWMVEHVTIFSGYQATNLAVLQRDTSVDQLRGGCLVVGGSRGSELVSDYVVSTLPEFARQATAATSPPADATLIREIRGFTSPLRTTNLRVLCFR
jgi:4-amino-4-deoxy-L-arabinose transferase-like glycosyltransferase